MLFVIIRTYQHIKNVIIQDKLSLHLAQRKYVHTEKRQQKAKKKKQKKKQQ